jgi:membrane-associated protease RseP (regulator of RpoE activity)
MVTAAAVVVCAGFAARAVSAVVAAQVAVEPAPPPLRPRPAPAVVPPHRDGDQLVDRNIFCSSCRPGAAPGDAIRGLPGNEATLIATGLGRDSSATLVVVATAVQGAWGIGDAIPGLGRLAHIAPTWIEIIDAGGHPARLSLRNAAADRGPDTAMPGPRSAAWTERLRALDEQTYEVDRSLIRELASGTTRPGAVRPVPVFEHGELLGIRLFGVGPDSLAAALRLRTGDTLTAIDGAPIKSLQQLLDLYAGLDQRTSLEVSVLRSGQPLVRVLRLR